MMLFEAKLFVKCLHQGLRSASALQSQHSFITKSYVTLMPKVPAGLLSRRYSIYEPDYINVVPEIDEYEELQFRFKGPDYVVLESYSKYVNSFLEVLGVKCDSHAVPARTSDVKSFKPNSTNMKNFYKLATYERVVQVQKVPNTVLPLFLDMIQQNLPEGVQMVVQEPNDADEDFRYVPDMMLKELKSQIAELEKAKEDRKKK